MKKILSIIFVFIILIGVSGCSNGIYQSVLLKSPDVLVTYDNYHNIDEKFLNNLSKFSSKLSFEYQDFYEIEDNFVISPVSIYMALAMVVECSEGETREEVLNALGMTYDEVKTNTKLLFEILTKEGKYGSKLMYKQMISNSIWFDKSLELKDNILDSLANDYYCYPYQTDFLNNNKQANKDIRNFVKEKTKGLIDQDFKLNDLTLFALINTYYLKDVWINDGDELSFTNEEYDFENRDKSIKKIKLMNGLYQDGRIQEYDTFKTFYTQTANGTKIKFILPKDGYSIDDIYNYENIELVNGIKDYQATDSVNKVSYQTRCLFPKFESESNNDLSSLFAERFNVKTLFDSDKCDYTNITDTKDICCTKFAHMVKFKTDEVGMEGAAVTIVANGAESIGGSTYDIIFEDFVIDKSFAYIVTDSNDIMLFSGIVNDIE